MTTIRNSQSAPGAAISESPAKTTPPEAAICGAAAAAACQTRSRPWIWVIVAHFVIIAMVTTVITIAQKHPPKEIPIVRHHER